MSSNTMTVRFAQPEDAAVFAEWIAHNDQIPRSDVELALSENNPTTQILVIERDGRPIFFVPLLQVLRIAYLGFDPELSTKDKTDAMAKMLDAIKILAMSMNIRQVDTLTVSSLPVARWARHNGFVPDKREIYELTVRQPAEV